MSGVSKKCLNVILVGIAVGTLALFFSTRNMAIVNKDSSDKVDVHTDFLQDASNVNTGGEGQALAGFFKLPAAANTAAETTLLQAQKTFAKYCTTATGNCTDIYRFGNAGDGGYEVCLDDKYAPHRNNCLIYSFGIGNKWQFDDAFQQYGCEVHSFDPSINLPDHTRAPKHYFHNLGLWHEDMTNKAGWKLATLGTIMNTLGHDKTVIDVMKVDIEGAEWPFLHQFIKTTWPTKIKQLIFEIHTPTFKNTPMSVKEYVAVQKNLDDLQADYGYQLYRNLHNNGCCGRFAVLTPAGMVSRQKLCCYELYFINAAYQQQK